LTLSPNRGVLRRDLDFVGCLLDRNGLYVLAAFCLLQTNYASIPLIEMGTRIRGTNGRLTGHLLFQ
jgi:hypothetical protein